MTYLSTSQPHNAIKMLSIPNIMDYAVFLGSLLLPTSPNYVYLMSQFFLLWDCLDSFPFVCSLC
jgi:hypothetical protein